MRYIPWFIALLCSILAVATVAAKRPQSDVERLTQAVAKSPGDMALRCQLVEALLEAGDTTAANEALRYAMKIEETGCLSMQKARMSLATGDIPGAARCGARAIKAGLMPDEDSLIYRLDSLSQGAVSMYVRQLSNTDKQNATLWKGLGQLAQQQQDSTAAVGYYETAFRLGDSTVLEALEALRTRQLTDSVTDTVFAEIPYTRQGKTMELRGQANGLAIRITLDTTATRSTISGVETKFMLKNEYLSESDIRENNTAVVIHSLTLSDSVVLQDVLLHHRVHQEQPIILCLRDLEALGRVRINEQKRVLEIRR